MGPRPPRDEASPSGRPEAPTPTEGDPLEAALLNRLRDRLESDALRREALYRRQLERAVEVLERTRHAFRSKQLKQLREEIEGVLKSD